MNNQSNCNLLCGKYFKVSCELKMFFLYFFVPYVQYLFIKGNSINKALLFFKFLKP